MAGLDTKYWRDHIDQLDHEGLARLARFAPAGHPVFTTPELTEHFDNRFEGFGGMTSEISKRIGWQP